MDDESPCIGVCQIDESGYCLGCGRSADEIFGETASPPPPVEGESRIPDQQTLAPGSLGG
ncbi:MAG: DUF1289 domain-containing protein [Rhodocyclaceae bacterium]|nr:DUF1289 domain-containing protein [Rhodocyclaceae bacterium]